jgi:hypothetical protein
MIPCVIVIRDDVVEENIQCLNAEHAEKVFVDKCASNLSNWDEYTSEDQSVCVEDGYALFGTGSVCLSWAMTEDEI